MKKRLFAGIVFGLLFGGFTYLVKTYDVAAIGPDGTSVGFSKINIYIHNFTGFNPEWYEITDLIGYVALAIAALFALTGLIQLISRKSLFKVDREIIGMGVLYVVVVGLYVLFEKVIINYRPIIMPNATAPEASFPSSHTMLIMTVLGAAIILFKRKVSSKGVRTLITLICGVTIVVTVLGRLYSGVHWFTDIVAGVLLSMSLIELYGAFVYGGKSAKRADSSGKDGYKAKH